MPCFPARQIRFKAFLITCQGAFTITPLKWILIAKQRRKHFKHVIKDVLTWQTQVGINVLVLILCVCVCVPFCGPLHYYVLTEMKAKAVDSVPAVDHSAGGGKKRGAVRVCTWGVLVRWWGRKGHWPTTVGIQVLTAMYWQYHKWEAGCRPCLGRCGNPHSSWRSREPEELEDEGRQHHMPFIMLPTFQMKVCCLLVTWGSWWLCMYRKKNTVAPGFPDTGLSAQQVTVQYTRNWQVACRYVL